MQFDVYQQCPGATGKKIKFCGCKEILPQLDKLFRTAEGGQRQAALELALHIDADTPDRPCVLMQIVELQMESKNFEAADATLARFLEAHPRNPVAHAQAAVANMAKGDFPTAVVELQKAIECSDTELSLAVYETMGLVGQGLMRSGNLVAGRAHTLMQAMLAPEDDNRPTEVLERLNKVGGVPLMLKQDWRLVPPPDDAPWAEAYRAALTLESKLQWAPALVALVRLAEQYPEVPALVRGQAILRGRLGDTEGAVAAWRKFAALEAVSQEEAIEAEAYAQLLDPASHESQLDVVRFAYEIDDLQALSERLQASDQTESILGDLAGMVQDDGPPPKMGFWLLDKPLSKNAEATLEEIPSVLAQLLLYGKQTDRAARLEFTLPRDSRYEETLQHFAQVAGEGLGEAQEEVVSQEPRIPTEMTLRLRFPAEMPPTVRRDTLKAARRQTLLERWPEIPLDVLEGKTAREVAADDAYRTRLLAAILLLELSPENTPGEQDMNELREVLGLPILESIELGETDPTDLPLARLRRVKLEPLSDGALAQLMRIAVYFGDSETAYTAGHELLKREQLDVQLDRASLCGLLAQLSEAEEALELARQAQTLAREAGQPIGQYVLLEMEVQLQRGEVQETQRLLRQIEANHLKEPGVADALMQILMEAGVVGPDGRPAGPPPGAPPMPEEAAASADLWTPEAGAGASSSGGEEGGSKLWVPGMD